MAEGYEAAKAKLERAEAAVLRRRDDFIKAFSTMLGVRRMASEAAKAENAPRLAPVRGGSIAVPVSELQAMGKTVNVRVKP